MTLAEILAPMTVRTFCDEYQGKRFVRIDGQPNRFEGVVTWDEMDEALSRLRATDGRVMLIKRGKPVPRRSYVYSSPSGAVHYLIGHRMLSEIGDGATLVLEQVDELFPRVRKIAESCEDLWHVHVHANLYAGWRTDNGFDVHWDKHDTLIVQIRGRKHWAVWHPTRLHPLPEESNRAPLPGDAPPAWAGLLESGQVLYMPRGWWHVARPIDEPSLHVTFGIRYVTGAEMLKWVVDQLSEVVELRQDVPHWRPIEERDRWCQALRHAMVSALTPDAIDRHMAATSRQPHQRAVVTLPRGPLAGSEPIASDSRLRWTAWRRPTLAPKESTQNVMFEAAGTTWACDSSLRPALALLDSVQPRTMAALCEAVHEESRTRLQDLVTALASAGAIWVEPRREGA